MKDQRITVYTGPGSSNSWVWLADFLEKYDILNVHFSPHPEDFLKSSERAIAIIPGGDTFAMAESFGAEGLRRVERLIAGGTTYIGICAGAYLPLRSSIHPLSAFNLVNLRISNISSSLPATIKEAERYSVRYGCGYVFHPVRGPVRMTGDTDIVAPLYGGPIVRRDQGTERIRLLFDQLTEESEILVGRELCERIMIGNAACVETQYKEGRLLLVSPHLEHPDYPAANEYFAALICGYSSWHTPHENECESVNDGAELRGIIADLRVAASGLEDRSWKIGIKYWESEKLLFFIESVRRRLEELRKNSIDFAPPIESLESFKAALKGLKNMENDEEDIEKVLNALSNGASSFLNAYFSFKMSFN